MASKMARPGGGDGGSQALDVSSIIRFSFNGKLKSFPGKRNGKRKRKRKRKKREEEHAFVK